MSSMKKTKEGVNLKILLDIFTPLQKMKKENSFMW